MTCREKLAIEHPELVGDAYYGGAASCPHEYGYLDKPKGFPDNCERLCTKCWDRKIPEKNDGRSSTCHGINAMVTGMGYKYGHTQPIAKVVDTKMENDGITVTLKPCKNDEPRILDSGNRREFETGAVRDIQEGKGRCDLLPLDVAAQLLGARYDDRSFDIVLDTISGFVYTGDLEMLYKAVEKFIAARAWNSTMTMLLEVSKHFEEGAKKYGDNNWQKGIPVKCYIDSAVRHYLKYLRGDTDEPHDRAFCWNILCAIWTCYHKPELNDYAKESDK